MSNPLENVIQHAQKMQEYLQKIQKECMEIKVTGEAGAGLVKMVLNGNGDVLDVQIDDSVYQESKQVLQDLVAAAANDANCKRERLKNEKLKKLSGDRDFSKNFNFPFML